MRQRVRLILLAVLVCSAAAVHGALPTFWQSSTEADFLRGEVENLSIDSYGRLTLGPTSRTLYESSAPFVWAVVGAPDGTVYAGTGNEGQVLRIPPTGAAGVFFDAEELEVHALAAAPDGGLYAGTSPDGRIYKVDRSGAARVFFDPPDRYIWSLAVDARGVVFAATGDKGVIYRIAPDGTGAPFYATKATHAMTLAFDREGRLLAGTESPGRVFRIDAAGRAFVLLDSSYNEIHTLRVDAAGTIYAAAVGGRASAGSVPAPAAEPTVQTTVTPSVSTDFAVVAVVDTTASAPAQASAPAARQAPGAGAVFRILPDGASDLLWESREDAPYDVAFTPDGALLVATGGKGKIFRLAGDPYQPTLLARANAQQVTALLNDRDGQVLFATSNPGRILRLSAASAASGTYTSDVRDAQGVATWGTIRWQATPAGGAGVAIATRSGNTRTPDETWSDWSAPYTERDGSPMTSPRARYLQWRAVLTAGPAGGPLLTSVTAAYLPRNTRPRVASITVHPPGTVFARPFPTDPEIAGFDGDVPDRRALQAQPQGTPGLGRRMYQKGLLTLIWRAEDDNRDDLAFEVSYRREGDTTWKLLRRGLADSLLVWDTTSVPNGRYIVRVSASDSPSNASAAALAGTMESAAFDIDNMPPAIAVSSVRRESGRLTVAFDVRDEHSAVQKAEYSLDGDRWVPLYPADGILDSRAERFELVLEGDAASRGVILRATDMLNNVSSARGEVPAGAAPASGRR